MPTHTRDDIKGRLKYVLVGLFSFYAIVQLIQLFLQLDLFPLNKFNLGIDFRDYYNALQHFKNDVSIYSDELIVTPPTFLLFLQPLGYLSFENAVQVYFLINIILVLLCIFASMIVLNVWSKETFIIINLICLASFPFIFLIERGNIDLLVLLFFSCGLLLYKKEYKFLAGAFLSISISLKIYPVLLVIPLMMKREFKCLGGIVSMLFVLFICLPNLYFEFFQLRISPLLGSDEFSRFTHFRMDENGSLANLFYGIIYYIKSSFGLSKFPIAEHIVFKFSNCIYILFLLLLTYRISKINLPAIHSMVLYTPLMVAIPKLSFLYEYVILLPLIILLLSSQFQKKEKLYSLMLILACLLVFMNTVVLEKIWQTERYHFLPSLGLLLLMFACLNYTQQYNQVSKNRIE